MRIDPELPELARELKDEAKSDARDHLRRGSAVDPDGAALDLLFTSALNRVTLHLGVGDLPAILTDRLRRDYEREFSRRLGNETGRWPLPKLVI